MIYKYIQYGAVVLDWLAGHIESWLLWAHAMLFYPRGSRPEPPSCVTKVGETVAKLKLIMMTTAILVIQVVSLCHDITVTCVVRAIMTSVLVQHWSSRGIVWFLPRANMWCISKLRLDDLRPGHGSHRMTVLNEVCPCPSRRINYHSGLISSCWGFHQRICRRTSRCECCQCKLCCLLDQYCS